MMKIIIALVTLTYSVSSFANEDEVRAHIHEVVSHLQVIDSAGVNNPVTVGDEANCQFSSIQAAINSGADQVRIMDKGSPYFENLEIIDRTVALKGNYANCQDASNDVTSDVKAVIDGSQNRFVLTIGNSNPLMQYNTISNLVFQNGSFGAGGGLYIAPQTKVFVALNNVVVRNNTANAQGGGIYFASPSVESSHLYIKDSLIENNSASGVTLGHGGGIYSSSNNSAKILIVGETQIVNNSAMGDGGLSLRNMSAATIFSPVIIRGNKSYKNAGGLTVFKNTNLFGKRMCEQGHCFGSNTQPISITDNVADFNDDGVGDGGGIVFFGINQPDVNIYNVLIKGNRAINGGGFYMSAESNQGGSVTFNSSRFEENSAGTGAVGTLIGSADPFYDPLNVTIKDSVIINNGDPGLDGDDYFLFYVETRSTLSLINATIANNHVLDRLIMSVGTGVLTKVYSSIVDETNRLFFGTSSWSVDCLLVRNGTGLPLVNYIKVGVASFVNPAAGDYHLTANSIAIDFCDQAESGLKDMDGVTRGYDDPNINNLFGTYDLGAYELSDIIFEDSFDF